MPLAGLSETWYLFFVCVSIALAAWMVFIWAVRSGQFRDPERTAERMVELDERDEPLPDPEGTETANDREGRRARREVGQTP